MPIASVNPATGETLRLFPPFDENEIEARLARATETFATFSRTPLSERSRKMVAAASILESEKERIGRLMTLEMGKPINAAREEAAKCAWVCHYYAEMAKTFLADEVIETSASRSFVHYQPLGPVLAVMPWNFPFWQVFRFAAPALMAGNVGLLKHASNVPQCALEIEDIFRRAGFPEGSFQTLFIGAAETGRVVEDERVMAATLTGSEPAGSAVASAAGRQIKKTVLELGGSDPFIVMPSADLDEAVKTGVRARTINNGQSCIAAKRFIISSEIYDDFESRFVQAMASLRIGDPMDESVDVGPLATSQIAGDLEEQVRVSIQKGARLLTGGKRLEGPGNYFQPTVLSEIPLDSPAYREEMFGPVAALFRAHDIDEAIAIANDTTFGLGSSAWTNDEEERERFIDEIKAGAVFINGMVASDPRLPFGGTRRSGYGRELGMNGIREFVNVKTVWIRQSGGPSRLTRSE